MTARVISILLFIVSASTYYTSTAQNPTDLYLFNLQKSTENEYHIYNPKFLSGFNPGGYTNQPWFTPSGDLLVSVRKAKEKQNDIYLLSVSSRKVKQITQTSANEYSPRVEPDGKHWSVLRQVEGDPLDQQVFEISLQDKTYKSLTPDIRNIGYYAWLSAKELGLFTIEGDVNRLVFLMLTGNVSRKITSAIGRSLYADSKGSIIYVHKFTEDYWYLKKYNPATTLIEVIVETPGKTEDYTLAPDGTFFIAKDQKLFSFNPSYQTTWSEIADLSIYGVNHITRLSVSTDGKQIAVVSEQASE
jgi:Tol biopolymer transport system component